MKLTVLERFALGSMVPSQAGRFETLKLVREGREALSFNEEEVKKLNPTTDEGVVRWNPAAASEIGEVDIPLSGFFIGLIKTELIKMNDEEKLPESYFSIYEKFVLNNS